VSASHFDKSSLLSRVDVCNFNDLILIGKLLCVHHIRICLQVLKQMSVPIDLILSEPGFRSLFYSLINITKYQPQRVGRRDFVNYA
jgi:hypothetical protein